jgi:hypothetical protein
VLYLQGLADDDEIVHGGKLIFRPAGVYAADPNDAGAW